MSSVQFTIFSLSIHSTLLTLLIITVCRTCVAHQESLPVVHWIERPPGVFEVMGSNSVGDSDFFFVPRSWHETLHRSQNKRVLFYKLRRLLNNYFSFVWEILYIIILLHSDILQGF